MKHSKLKLVFLLAFWLLAIIGLSLAVFFINTPSMYLNMVFIIAFWVIAGFQMRSLVRMLFRPSLKVYFLHLNPFRQYWQWLIIILFIALAFVQFSNEHYDFFILFLAIGLAILVDFLEKSSTYIGIDSKHIEVKAGGHLIFNRYKIQNLKFDGNMLVIRDSRGEYELDLSELKESKLSEFKKIVDDL